MFSEETDFDEEKTRHVTNLEQATYRVVQDSEQRLCELLKEVEGQLLSNEAKMKDELEAVIDKRMKENKQVIGDELDPEYEEETGDDNDDSTQDSIRQFTRSDLDVDA